MTQGFLGVLFKITSRRALTCFFRSTGDSYSWILEILATRMRASLTHRCALLSHMDRGFLTTRMQSSCRTDAGILVTLKRASLPNRYRLLCHTHAGFLNVLMRASLSRLCGLRAARFQTSMPHGFKLLCGMDMGFGLHECEFSRGTTRNSRRELSSERL